MLTDLFHIRTKFKNYYLWGHWNDYSLSGILSMIYFRYWGLVGGTKPRATPTHDIWVKTSDRNVTRHVTLTYTARHLLWSHHLSIFKIINNKLVSQNHWHRMQERSCEVLDMISRSKKSTAGAWRQWPIAQYTGAGPLHHFRAAPPLTPQPAWLNISMAFVY